MARKKKENIRVITGDISTLTGNRKKLFRNMRKLYPKGNEKSQMDMCMELRDERVDYYLKYIFNPKEK